MRITHLLVLFLVVSMIGLLAVPAFAADGGATYKAKCAMCHGPNGEGKMGPKLAGTALSADQIIAMITKGDEAKKAPHKKAVAGVSDEDAKAVAEYVKSLK